MANRFWVGGTALWNTVADSKWALTSGGAGGQAVPTSADDVFFDAASGAVTCTLSSSSNVAKSINCTGFTGTLAGSAFITISGSLTLVVGMTYTFSASLVFNATGTITTAGKTLGGVTINTSGGTTTLGDPLTTNISSSIVLTTGTLNLNGFLLSTGAFSSTGTGARAITFGSQNIVLTSIAAGTALSMSNATNFTWTGTGGFTYNEEKEKTFNFGSAAGGSATNAPNLTCNVGGEDVILANNSWFKALNLTGCTKDVVGTNISIAGNLTLGNDEGAGQYNGFNPVFVGSSTFDSNGTLVNSCTINGSGITVTCADAFEITAALTLTDGTLKLKSDATSKVGSLVTTGTTLKYLESTTPGVRATISDTSGTNTVTYLSIKDINATGGAVFNAVDLTNINAGNNLGWVFPPSMLLMFM